MEYCSSVLCLHPIRQSLYMGLMGCTACGGISYPPCTNGLHDVKNTLENAWLNTDNSQTFGLYVHYRGLKRHPQIKCSLQGNKNIEVPPRKVKKLFHGNKKLSRLFTSRAAAESNGGVSALLGHLATFR